VRGVIRDLSEIHAPHPALPQVPVRCTLGVNGGRATLSREERGDRSAVRGVILDLSEIHAPHPALPQFPVRCTLNVNGGRATLSREERGDTSALAQWQRGGTSTIFDAVHRAKSPENVMPV
jgi:hypothetical protein